MYLIVFYVPTENRWTRERKKAMVENDGTRVENLDRVEETKKDKRAITRKSFYTIRYDTYSTMVG